MKSITILLVEDNEGDVLLTTEALESCKITNTLKVVNDGKEALDFVFKKGPFATEKTPDLILLDVNLPKKNGHEVLQILKADSTYKHIPVVMLTTSSSTLDIKKAYSHYVNCYITKPVEPTDFLSAVAQIENFWINIVKLP
ncbi:response regulator [Cellulophaga baltica]|uniref:CheY chemotaxis protein or a CheY-like REC (Receiver) domain n=1 Tax=Cellulophaga baltica TaxID=76594 RepID=A0A1G7D418_9FLAO|nr:response regulator [Cellulophaga baltica]AIY12981.1 chemotaxis protein CheY [Cellulophaga baltica NN016038]SDE46328.1 CheY chemotaxis protein or a CheY-like REC (receiver) domain [Cellulophaga baltica]